MTILKPKDTPSPYAGSSEYYESYKMIDSDTSLGRLHHSSLISVALFVMKHNPNWTFNVKSIRTQIHAATPPAQDDKYLTTIEFSVIGETDVPIEEVP